MIKIKEEIKKKTISFRDVLDYEFFYYGNCIYFKHADNCSLLIKNMICTNDCQIGSKIYFNEDSQVYPIDTNFTIIK